MKKERWEQLLKRINTEKPEFGKIIICLNFHSARLVKITFKCTDITLLKNIKNNENE